MVIFISLSRMVQTQGVSVTKIMISGTVWARVETGLWCLLTMSKSRIQKKSMELDLQSAGSSPYLTYKDYVPVMPL